jgi:glutaredoxin
MGRITIFVADCCPDSLRAIMAMKALGIPCVLINVTKYPAKRNDMMSLSRQVATPQIFFNTRHVGGANDLIELMQDWEETCSGSHSCDSSVSTDGSSCSFTLSKSPKKFINGKKHRNGMKKQSSYESVKERFMVEIGQHHDPMDERLAIPTGTPVETALYPRNPFEVACIRLPHNDMSTVVEMTEMLKDLIRHNGDHEAGGISYRKSFLGHEVISVLCGVFVIPSKEAFKLAQELLTCNIFHSLQEECASATFNSKLLYRLQCHHSPDILNSYRIWTERIDPDSLRLLKGLVDKMHAVEMALTDMTGKRKLMKAAKLSEFISFEEAVCELQGVSLLTMDDATKLVCAALQRLPMSAMSQL